MKKQIIQVLRKLNVFYFINIFNAFLPCQPTTENLHNIYTKIQHVETVFSKKHRISQANRAYEIFYSAVIFHRNIPHKRILQEVSFPLQKGHLLGCFFSNQGSRISDVWHFYGFFCTSGSVSWGFLLLHVRIQLATSKRKPRYRSSWYSENKGYFQVCAGNGC